jgi:hypothetical protein
MVAQAAQHTWWQYSPTASTMPVLSPSLGAWAGQFEMMAECCAAIARSTFDARRDKFITSSTAGRNSATSGAPQTGNQATINV